MGYDRRLLEYAVILSATQGNIVALDAVVRHYSSYIATLARQTAYDEWGNPYSCVNEDIRSRLESKLTAKVLAFRAQVP
jgi:hypothetical protein